MSETGYKAFISYSHADSREAAWLQRSLESFRVPARLVGKESTWGPVPQRIGRVFRDREELAAGDDLGEFLNDALGQSEFLIVVCSPSAHESRWMNLEIEQFRRTHDDSRIFCLIVDGEPFASRSPETAHLECFPEALGYGEGSGNEPIAADLRPQGDGKRLARLKLVAGLLGVKLDELVQRDTQRRVRRLYLATAASFLGMLAFAFVSYLAIEARDGEQQRRAEAEDLIEFMLGDLRDRLNEVGRLDVLDVVGDKAIEYYTNSPLAEYRDPSLGRRARAFHLLGEVSDLQGDLESAREAFDEALQSTAMLLERDPNNAERVYEHAQSVFWVGYLDWRIGNLPSTEAYFREYLELAERMVAIDADNPTWQMELGNAQLNLGVYFLDLSNPETALDYFESSREIYDALWERNPADADAAWQLGQSLAFLSDTHKKLGNPDLALRYREDEIRIYSAMQRENPGDQDVALSLLTANGATAQLQMETGAHDDAIASLRRAGEIGEALRVLDPENTFVAAELARNDVALSRLLLRDGEPVEARQHLERAETIAADLLGLNPEVEEWQELDGLVRALATEFGDGP